MHDDENPTGSLKTCRLFPLPGMVLFPHAVLPLHIFEPRYRQMTEDALATDNLITMVQSKARPSSVPQVEPVPIEPVGCLGKIIRYERLADGRFNLLLLGLSRVRFHTEIPSKKLYRLASAERIEDVHSSQPEGSSRSMLIELFRAQIDERRAIDPDLRNLLDSDTITLGALADIVAHSLELEADVKQSLLAEGDVARRIEILLHSVGDVSKQFRSIPSSTFPPPFSLN